jgi:hypothetical protein
MTDGFDFDGEDGGVPPLELLGPADFDMSRVAAIGIAAMERQPPALRAMHESGDLAGEWAMTPFDPETGMASLSVIGVPVAAIHYSRLWKGVDLDLVGQPPVQLPAERVRVDWPPDDAA